MQERITPPRALILAGGDGTRLRPLTAQIAGDARPKQFCAILDGETLLDRTRRRADRLVPGDRQAVVVTRSHARFYEPLVQDLAPGRLIAQPGNRGTAPAIAYSMLRILAVDGDVPVIVMPSDHYVDDDRAFMACVNSALDAVRARPALITLLGIEPAWPEPEYGWIEPGGMPLSLEAEAVLGVRRFIEKPDVATAHALYHRGCLWNSFVMTGWVSAFLRLLAETRPALLDAFAPLRNRVGGRGEEAVAARVYRSLPPNTGFSEASLAAATHRLGVVKVKGVEWSDWGHPRRVLASLRRTGLRPAWFDRVELAEAG
jgi:mannose-1-phosphate guanylyltransferase